MPIKNFRRTFQAIAVTGALVLGSTVTASPSFGSGWGLPCGQPFEPYTDYSGCLGDGGSYANSDAHGSSFVGSTLTVADLSNSILQRVNFTSAQMFGANFRASSLEFSNFASVVGNGTNFEDANLFYSSFTGASLYGANFRNANLYKANLGGADLSYANLNGAVLQDVNLAGAVLRGVQSNGINGTPTSLPSGWNLISGVLIGPAVNLEGLDLGSANLDNVDLTRTSVEGANFSKVTLGNVKSGFISGTPAALPADWKLVDGYLVGNGADLSGAVLTTSDLTNANLKNTNLAGADLSGATLSGVRSGGIRGIPSALPSGWSIVDGYLVGPGANLDHANFGGSDLSNVNLVGATLRYADLSGANLESADLTNAVLTAADLQDASLSRANLTGTNLNRANIDTADFLFATLNNVSDQNVDWRSARCGDGGYGSTHLANSCLGPALTQAVATSAPKVTGLARVNAKKPNSVLTTGGTWTGVPIPTQSYQWYTCKQAVPAATAIIPTHCTKIAKATTKTLKVLPAYKGKFLSVSVTGTSVGTPATVILAKSAAKVS